jgi:hypothetical protein
LGARSHEFAVLIFGHSLIHTCKSPGQKPGFCISTRAPAIVWKQLAFIATLEMGNRDLNGFVLWHLYLDAPIEL